MEIDKLRDVTVLYCEDERQLHDVTAQLLGRLVKKVISAYDGEEGLRLYREQRNTIDMVVTDIGMPRMSGLEMTREIKTITPYIPVIVTTAYSSTEHLFEAIDIHVDKYVLKPLDTRKLIEAMHQSLLYHELRTLYRDPLTGLQTRTALIRDLSQSKGNRLILINIDQFANVNELYGEEVGSTALAMCAQMLEEHLDLHCTLYRTGYDNFLIRDRKTDRSTETIRARLNALATRCKEEGLTVGEIPIYLVLVFAFARSEDGHTLYYLQRAIQQASRMHERLIECEPQVAKNTSEREKNIWWTCELNRAEDSGRFRPYFQPIVDTQTRQVQKYEALIRYVDKKGKLYGPEAFFEIAHRSNLYPIVMRVVLKQVIETIQNKQVHVAVNISYEDLINHETMAYIQKMLDAHPDEAPFLEFEVLESEKIDNYEVANRFIRMVRGYGCEVGIDDFGSGYSNFEMIEALKVDYVKINGRLIQGIDTSKRQELIVETIHTFCHKLGIKTVAEMVGNEAEYRIIKSIGIDWTQGWYISREIESDAIGQ